MGVPTGYELAEPGFGFKQLGAAPKPTGGTTGTAYGDALFYDSATSKWTKATSGSLRPFGFNGNTKILSQTTDNLTGVTTFTRGSADADTNLSVVVAGRIVRQAGAAITPNAFVMLDGTTPLSKVKQWDGVHVGAIVGRYVLNFTQHHDMDVALPSAALNDIIEIDKHEDSELEVTP
jgi:hypothetical protein